MTYVYYPPTPIVVPLTGDAGFKLRKTAQNLAIETGRLRGPQSGSEAERSYGFLAQMVIRNALGMPPINPAKDEGFDLSLPSGVKVDIKCRGGTLPFKEEYEGSGGFKREAKHNFFANQVYSDKLETDIYILTHLETPKAPRGSKTALPGTLRQKKWKLYVCGWVSKKRVKREGVYLPRGSITEQGNQWFAYRSEEIEFYNRHLNGFKDLKDIITIDKKDVKRDIETPLHLHLTSVDAVRIAIDLVGFRIMNKKLVGFIKQNLGINGNVPTILNPNQYYHLLRWLKSKGKVNDKEIKKLAAIMKEVEYKGKG
jgi:hypothetical protein